MADQCLPALCIFLQSNDGIRNPDVTGLLTCFFYFQAEDGIRDADVTGVLTCALPISAPASASLLFSARPDLEKQTLAPMKAVDIKARDGLVLPCYLTLPVGVPVRGLPMVLLVHGEIGRASCRARV